MTSPFHQLVIIGAGGYARETCHTAEEMLSKLGIRAVKGFLDDRTSILDSLDGYPPVLGSVEEYQPAPEDVFVCALGESDQKRHFVQLIKAKGGTFVSIIHPTAIIRKNVRIGDGCIIGAFAIVSCDTVVEDFVTIMAGCIVGHDVIIESWAHLGVFTFLGGGVTIREGAQLYTRSTILPKVNIGTWATIGAGSLVTKNVSPEATVFGSPAKPLRIGSRQRRGEPQA